MVWSLAIQRIVRTIRIQEATDATRCHQTCRLFDASSVIVAACMSSKRVYVYKQGIIIHQDALSAWKSKAAVARGFVVTTTSIWAAIRYRDG